MANSKEQAGYDELRKLVLGQEQERISRLEHRLDNQEIYAESVSAVLPEAVMHSSRQGNKLSNALTPAVEDALKRSVQRNPRALSDALFPVMGPAIRKAITSTLSGMLQSLNQALEHAFSIQGLKWRLEAIRTGKSFAEVVMLKTVVFRVEQLFLIHAETGLLLHHVTADDLVGQDGDMVSGMLTALQDFVRDSFATEESDTLESMQVGGLHVWVERGPKAVLAAVIRGSAPSELRQRLIEATEDIHARMGNELEAFDGDATPFELIHDELRSCLQARYQREKAGGGYLLPVAAVMAGALLLTWAGWSYYQHQKWQALINALKSEPGLIVIEYSHDNGYFIRGLRDAMADTPDDIVNTSGIEGVTMIWEPYYSLQDDFILRRAKSTLMPPEGVVLSVTQGMLLVEGRADDAWVSAASNNARFIPGVSSTELRVSSLAISDEELLRRVKSTLTLLKAVSLKVKDATLYISGEAGDDWIRESMSRIKSVEGLRTADATRLINIDDPAYILNQARRTLLPPSTIRLQLKGRILMASGSAGKSWLSKAEQLSSGIRGVSVFDGSRVTIVYGDDEILLRARTVLNPPDSIHLTIHQGRLTASGRAPSEWIRQFKEIAPTIEGVIEYNADIIDIEEALAHLKAYVDSLDLNFIAYKSELEPGESDKLGQLADEISASLLLMAEANALIEVEGNTGNLGDSERNRTLAMARAIKVQTMLIAEGIEERFIRIRKESASRKEADKKVTLRLIVGDSLFESSQ